MLPMLPLRVLALRELALLALPFDILLLFMLPIVPVLLVVVLMLPVLVLPMVLSVVVVLVVPVVPVVDVELVVVVVEFVVPALLLLSLEQADMNRPNAATTRRARIRRIEFPPIDSTRSSWLKSRRKFRRGFDGIQNASALMFIAARIAERRFQTITSSHLTIYFDD
jgi:hypothetical protein